jgi:hypothetical protein
LNWLFFFIVCFSGLLSGYCTWLISPDTNPWNLVDNFQSGLLVTGVFCGLFTGLVSALPVIIMEWRRTKAVAYWISATSVGLSITMLGAVVFAIVANLVVSQFILPSGVLRFFWWMFLSLCLAGCFGILHGSLRIMCRAIMGLTPAFIIAGSFIDSFSLTSNHLLVSFLFLGGTVGFGFALAWDLLKESWIDEDRGRFMIFRYYIDGSEFVAGKADECDLTLPEGPAQLFVVSEKDGLHVLEVLEEDQMVKVNHSQFRYRVLVDGDSITVGDRVFIYHSKLARSRDALPEAVA